MDLTIDGIRYLPATGESLLEILRKLELDNVKLSARPLAAKIAGEVFNLNYIPVREKDIVAERPSIRAAMAASNGVVRLLRIGDASGREVLVRGVPRLRGARVSAPDLRAGAALVIAGLSAQGTTSVENIHCIERGYERLVEKMTALGANIRKIED